jgi:hypothetical protein
MANGSRSRKSPRRSSGGKGGGWFFAVILAAAIFAFYQIPSDPSISGTWNTAVAKSKAVEIWAKDTANGLLNLDLKVPEMPTGGNNGGNVPDTGGSTPAVPPAATDTATKLNALVVADSQDVDYDRDEWKHWDNVTSCWSVREQVLADEAVAGSLVLLDAKDKKTTNVAQACKITSGKWIDPYTNKEFTDPGKLDIDHMIPLSKAAQSGAQGWDTAKKKAYANDRTYANHLLAVDASANRSKSDQGPADWKPSNEGYWCEYATSWVAVSANYQLTVSADDKAALIAMLQKC